MNHKPHHKRHHRFSQRNQAMFIAGFMVVVVLALLALFLWWTNRPNSSPP